MPKALRDAQKAFDKPLDKEVDNCYRPAAFESERARAEYRFIRYQQLIAPLTAPVKARKRAKEA